MKKILLLFIISEAYISAENIVYNNNNLHAFLPKTNQLQIHAGFEKVNDTIDIFNIKESEFGSKSKKLDSLGDMKGINLNFGYAFNNKWYINIKLNKKDLQYSDSTLTNKNFDIYLRYQLYEDKNSAFAIDGGYSTNIASDTYINRLKTINNALKDIAPNKKIKISQTDNKYTLVYRESDGGIKTVKLKNKPYISIVDTDDTTFYIKAIFSIKKDKWLFDMYGGYAEISINNKTDSSILYEDDSDLKKELRDISFSQKRTDDMFFGGIGLGYNLNKWYSELNYQYNHLLRIDCLNETNINHVLNLNISYLVNQNLGLYMGGKLMLNQFNGEIPYLYGEYTKTSFDHKYGFLNAGIIYNF